ncbi:single-stranded-DNA-specific exonuclease RecJ [Falsibacillus albus]|uniref:Single-stranded-DNA-specific exonuclease RecJ n=1 Tax=Falsibacillus albus TaxID=2478915 RepID=A0A3L7KBX5_9BACI|nr:single-stranded-DNA-specific exonuclease RecJ [Falsibacillus albus]RLQ98092.1 single-stranded-DNA-specific exonuclease RecJ [Falsibacillus albus]
MLKSKSRWMVKDNDEAHINNLVDKLHIKPLVASLLVNRGLTDPVRASDFLFGEDVFHDPFLLTDMDITVERIKRAIQGNEPILVFGDYDADGVSSTTVMMTVLRDLGADVEFYIPNRFSEGYGPNESAFRMAKDKGFNLIITVDTGISALHEAKVAKELGIDLIITDHHEPGPILPDAFAIIHPKREDSQYPFSDLAGVGVAFKLAHALYGSLPEELLEIAAIGTIADLVPLQGENRSIVKKGLAKLRSSSRPGIKALVQIAGASQSEITEETVGFAIGPRINAVGRLGDADPAVELLLTESIEAAKEMAQEIDAINKERQSIVSEITAEAVEMVLNEYPPEENPVLVIGKEGWNAGVIGIVASRLVEQFYRPTIVLSYDPESGKAKGSARSIAGFDLFKNLSTCREILPHFGGHPMAAGMTLSIEDVPQLRERLCELAVDQLSEEDFTPITEVDGTIGIEDVHLDSIKELDLLSPFGVSNPKPKMLLKNLDLAAIKKIGANQTHLKLVLSKGQHSLDGVGFGLGDAADHISPLSKVSLIGELSINEWNNIRKPQVFVQDIHIEEGQLFDVRGIRHIDKWMSKVPTKQRRLIAFHPESMNLLRNTSEDVIIIQSEEEASRLDINEANVVLLDLPPNRSILEALLSESIPSRIYAYFHHIEDHFFSTMPKRDHFKWYYAFLKSKGQFDLNRFGDQLAKHRGWSRQTIDFMSQVFFELDFVTINNGFVSINPSNDKKDLSESKTYQMKQSQFKLENELLYSSYQELKAWFDERTLWSVHNEEEAEAWI